MATYNQRKQHVTNQWNINIQESSTLDPDVLLSQAILLLEANSYQQSIVLLNTAIKNSPSLAQAYYYLAIAMLRGKRPKLLKRIEIEEIDHLLNTATVMGDSDGTIQWFRALIRDDYYSGNRLYCPPPSVAEIVASILPGTTDINRLQVLLTHLPMFDNELYIALAEQIF